MGARTPTWRCGRTAAGRGDDSGPPGGEALGARPRRFFAVQNSSDIQLGKDESLLRFSGIHYLAKRGRSARRVECYLARLEDVGETRGKAELVPGPTRGSQRSRHEMGEEIPCPLERR